VIPVAPARSTEPGRPAGCLGQSQSVFGARDCWKSRSRPVQRAAARYGALARDDWAPRPQARPMMLAVAHSSSSNANDTLPDTE
jgi:hypothetical protein